MFPYSIFILSHLICYAISIGVFHFMDVFLWCNTNISHKIGYFWCGIEIHLLYPHTVIVVQIFVIVSIVIVHNVIVFSSSYSLLSYFSFPFIFLFSSSDVIYSCPFSDDFLPPLRYHDGSLVLVFWVSGSDEPN